MPASPAPGQPSAASPETDTGRQRFFLRALPQRHAAAQPAPPLIAINCVATDTMAGTKTLLAALAVFALAAAAHAQLYEATLMYNKDDCGGHFFSGTFEAKENCTTVGDCTDLMPGYTQYQDCVDNPNDIPPTFGDGAKYLVNQVFAGDTCEGEPIHGNVLVANECFSMGGSSYMYAACADGKVTIKDCTDSACTSCTVTEE